MLFALIAATAFGDHSRHIVNVEVEVPTPTGEAGSGEAVAMAMPNVRPPRRAAREGDVPFQCSSQGEDGTFLDAYATHKPRLFLRDGVVFFERQVEQYPASLDAWPSMTCVWEGNGRHVEYAVSWTKQTAADRCLAEQVPAAKVAPGTLHDFESGLPATEDPNGLPLGFSVFNDPDSTSAMSTTRQAPSRPGASRGNDVLKLDLEVDKFAGIVYLTPDAEGKNWSPVDMSGIDAISFWFYGRNSGNPLYFHLFDNRLPCSTTDDAERFTFPITDDFEGWRKIEVPFSELEHIDIERDTPNDGLGLTRVHGWALGALSTDQARTYFVDDIELHATKAD